MPPKNFSSSNLQVVALISKLSVLSTSFSPTDRISIVYLVPDFNDFTSVEVSSTDMTVAAEDVRTSASYT